MARTDPHSYFDPDQPRTDHVDLKWDVDFETKRLHGRATLRFVTTSRGPLDLDSRGLKLLSAATVDGRPVPFEVGEPDEILGSRIRLELPPGTINVVLDYEVSPDAVALQWLEPAQTLGGRHPFLFSQCQPHHARTLAPLQDSPVARVTYSAEVTVPETLVAVMSAGSDGEVPAEGGRKTYRFRMPQRIPTYLLALAVGDLASRDIGPRSRIYAEPATVDAAAYEFGEIESMMQTAEGIFGPYEWERYDMLVLPPAFPYGGMENPRLTFLTPTLLAGDRSLVAVVAHELAHSWTGNLVTNATVEHFWINEGFTVWAERRILEALQGREHAALSWALGRAGLEQDMARFGKGSPYTKLQTDLQGVNPDEVYSRVPYDKGALLVALLEQTAGRQAWDAFIREYIQKFRFTSITGEDLFAFLEEKLPGLAKKVNAKKWLHEPDLPANAPVFHSEKLDAVHGLAAAWSSGTRPSKEAVAAWSPDEALLFLQALPRPMAPGECAELQALLGLPGRRNYEQVAEWLTIALASDYEPCFEDAREVLTKVGRMKFLRPLYAAMAASPRTRALGRELYAQTAGKLHALSRRVVAEQVEAYPED